MTPPEAARPGSPRSARVRFATFNVLHGRTLVDGRPVSVRPAGGPAEPLVRAVASLDADVVALQEVDRLQERSGGVDQASAAAEGSGAHHWRYASAFHGTATADGGWIPEPSVPGLRVYGPRETGAGDAGTDAAGASNSLPSHGIALLSRLPVRHWRARRLAPAPVPMPLRTPGNPGLTVSRDQPRAALAAVLEGSRGPFTVVAVHLSFVPGWNLLQLRAVRAWIADLPGPRVLLGDFNLPGALPRAVLGPAGPAGGIRPRPGGTGTRPGGGPEPRGWRDMARTPTYPAHRPLVQLDHVLASGIGAGAACGAHAPSTPVSDHRPLVVELPL
ncbi:endonuclease/exonuclease/phosphatase family protein [Streptomyces sp. NPDC127038]|uniref:endonuclease/exonuclease/phosphatase family protein n=1 Tax=Streptomyces sp. NPDC127038 TaxID=3347114 RepID=UPI0036533401